LALGLSATLGSVNDDTSLAVSAFFRPGRQSFDTADAHGDGRSERLLARLKKER
jgi:aryl-alcohol dehydrogenase-like predicted oxidoreductase